MRQPLKSKTRSRGTQVSVVKSYPAPIGGWNDRDSLAAMKPTDAIAMENWFPRTTYCEIRGGYASHGTGLSAAGKTLAVYNALSGTNKLFVSDNSNLYDVTSAGAASAVVTTGITSGKWQWDQMGNGTDNYLMMFNGIDQPIYYDGTNYIRVTGASSPALTGVTTTNIITSMVFKGRLFVGLINKLEFWYLDAGAVGGALTKFDLSAIAKHGGYLMAMASWTIDAGDGPDDRAVFITSEGELIIYIGNNPSNAAAWALSGVYHVGKPMGRKCVKKYGGDLIILTENGAFPMSAAIQSATIDYKLALSFKIENSFRTAASLYGSNFGWTCVLLPRQTALLVNIPKSENGAHEQYVMNTITKSWCKFTGWDAEDMVEFNKELYFCQGTTVWKGWTGVSDNGTNIVAYCKTAFSYFDNLSQQKQFKMFRPVLAANGTVEFLTDIDVDFNDDAISGSAVFIVTSGATWDVSNWNEDYWASGLEIVKEWTSPQEWVGYCAAGKIKISTNTLTVQWISNDFLYEYGGVL